jgi:hypothetical protein
LGGAGQQFGRVLPEETAADERRPSLANEQNRRKEKSTGPPSVPLQPAKEVRHKGRTGHSLGFEVEKEKEKRKCWKRVKTPKSKNFA